MKCTKHVVSCALGILCLSCSLEYPTVRVDQRIGQIVERQSLQPVSEYTVFRAPSLPKEVKRAVSPWDPVEALIVALPHRDVIINRKLLTFYMAMIGYAVRVTDVIVLVDERESDAFQEILNQMASLNLLPYLRGQDGRQIRLVPARFNSKWIRDYGPLFALDGQGKIAIMDLVYGDVRNETVETENKSTYLLTDLFRGDALEIFGNLQITATPIENRFEDDTSAMYIANHLYQRHGYDIQTIRVPLQLQGGDFFADDGNNLFISSESLLLNGGHRLDLELVLKSYFNARSITYLEPLPGDTIKHLDMIFAPLGQNRFVLASYPAGVAEQDRYAAYLHHEAKRILDHDAEVLKRRFPGSSVVRIPMPPLERISELDGHIMVLTKGLFLSQRYPLPKKLISAPQRWGIKKLVLLCYLLVQYKELASDNAAGQLLEILGPSDHSRFSDEYEAVLHRSVTKLLDNDPRLLEWILQTYRSSLRGSGYEGLEQEELIEKLQAEYIVPGAERNPKYSKFIYRSYLNATFLNGQAGRMLLVPSYTGHEELEGEVRDLYRKLYPDTDIVFINADEIIRQYGAIHCVTNTVPDFLRVR